MNFTIEQEQESDGRWLAEVLRLPGSLLTARLRWKPWPRLRFSLFASLLNSLNTAKAVLFPLTFLSRLRHEPMAVSKSQAPARHPATARLASETTIRFP